MSKEQEEEMTMDVFDFGDLPLESIIEDVEEEIIEGDEGIAPEEKEENISDPSEEEEERVADEDKDKTTKEEDDPDGGSSSQKLYSSLASALAEEGIISSISSTDEIKGPEDLFNIIKEEIKKNEYSGLTEDQKEYLKALENGIPKEEFHAYKKAELDLQSISEEELTSNAELRKAVIVADLIEQGINKDRAEKIAQRSIDIGEDLDDAKESLISLQKINKKKFEEKLNKQKELKESLKKKEEDELNELKKKISEAKEIIPGIKLNEKVKKNVLEQMFKPVHVDEYGNQYNALTKARADDPIGFTINMHYLFNITNGFKNFDKLKINAKSKAAMELDNTLKGHTFIPQGDRAVEETSFDLDSSSDFTQEKLNNILL